MKALISSRRILSLSVPIIITSIGETIVDVTDAIFLARYGLTELGAVALADAVYGVAMVAVLAFVDGIQVLVARRAGEDRSEEIGKIFNQGVYLLLASGVAITILTKGASPFLTSWLISSEDVGAAADKFLQIVAFKAAFDGLNFAYSALFVGLLRTGPLIGATLILALSNTVLDYVLIFGRFGFPRLGIEGAAISSVVSEIAAFIFLTAETFRVFDVRKYGLFAFGKWNARLTRLLVRISLPVFLDGLVETIRWFLFFVIVERLGEQALAVSNIIYSCYIVFLVGLEGFSETTCSLVSHLIGRGHPSRLWTLLRRAMSQCYLTTIPVVVVALLFPHWVLSVFTSDAQAMEGSVNGLRVIAATVLIVIPSSIFASAVAGTGDTAAVFFIELLMSVAILAFAYGAALAFALPLEVVWMSEGVGWLLCAGLSYLWLKSGKWRRLSI